MGEIKADASEEDNDGETALHHAAAACQPDSIRLLLASGARADKQSFTEETPLDVAVQNPAFFLGKDSAASVHMLDNDQALRRLRHARTLRSLASKDSTGHEDEDEEL